VRPSAVPLGMGMEVEASGKVGFSAHPSPAPRKLSHGVKQDDVKSITLCLKNHRTRTLIINIILPKPIVKRL
jgi:hypothetical protein